jgi:S-methyl-5-thioribose-1-phosphate isomerase
MSTAPTLEAIRYARGSLQLLDQLKLPGETVFMDVADCDACWTMIRDMNVRGAPAIAIAAALALAVDLEASKASLSTSAEVSAFVAGKLDHLFTSRPTAVNLGEAVQRLKASASALAAAGASGADAAEQIIKECEAMLADDVAANRAIGAFGADALCAAVGKAPGAPLRVLTHCNTGSLATAGYGTALGVVRALRESDRLEHIYCNETRPYNQGARLTAYEIAFEKMPGTLICDSAAASLMAQKKVDAVVVGADRVADNGDTANKIGTYNLAVSCAYHGVPFFVAAPVSTLDPSTKKGDDIVIEDRPAEEITHVRGVRVAADGIGVWNPSFDVTPGSLIAGIITEKGVVQKTSNGTFEVGKFVAAAAGAAGAAAPAAAPAVAVPAGFYAMDVDSVLEYCASKPTIAAALGGKDNKNNWSAKEVGDGNINFVYIVSCSATKNAVVVKQGLPFVRVVGESWPLTQERVRYEAEALQTAHGFCPKHVPEVFLYDPKMSVIAMRFLEPPHIILRGGIVAGETYPLLAAHAGEYLATTLFGSSALAVGCERLREQRQVFRSERVDVRAHRAGDLHRAVLRRGEQQVDLAAARRGGGVAQKRRRAQDQNRGAEAFVRDGRLRVASRRPAHREHHVHVVHDVRDRPRVRVLRAHGVRRRRVPRQRPARVLLAGWARKDGRRRPLRQPRVAPGDFHANVAHVRAAIPGAVGREGRRGRHGGRHARVGVRRKRGGGGAPRRAKGVREGRVARLAGVCRREDDAARRGHRARRGPGVHRGPRRAREVRARRAGVRQKAHPGGG